MLLLGCLEARKEANHRTVYGSGERTRMKTKHTSPFVYNVNETVAKENPALCIQIKSLCPLLISFDSIPLAIETGIHAEMPNYQLSEMYST